ncbi:hypothetical protein ACMD2_16959, partial [Ananas comosus]
MISLSQRIHITEHDDLMLFLFVCTGWAGSAADMRVLHWCCESGGFMVSEGYAKYQSIPCAI